MKTPRFMACVPREEETPEGGEYVVDTDLGILWYFDEEDQGRVAEWLSDPVKDVAILAEAARLAGDWYLGFLADEENAYDGE